MSADPQTALFHVRRLIELTRNDPELQKEFLDLLLKKAGRLAADPGAE